MSAKSAILLQNSFAIHERKTTICSHPYSTELRLQHKRRVDTDKTVSLQTTHPKASSAIIQLLQRGLSTGMTIHREEEIVTTVFMHFTPYCLTKKSFLF
ncbi:hypothetical protein CDAR_193781 [Caerostris darwini]|uniref:Uncharacterized protein n=1 Tax=Caerostris darwini TaxID=1538125 RepID=A0AAV4UNR2_9ARAC|nr:hypothetical protein CDAR_193781 [Caerostris darwini]